MRVVWSWLKELCDFERHVDAEEAAAALTGLGLEVEAIQRVGEDFSGVVIAEVTGKRPHPSADKLTLVDVVDAAGGGATEVVCGAPNVPEPGGRVLWARPGAVLPGGFEIGKKKLKGVVSAGMLCSETELGLGEDASGIIVLAGEEARAPLGAEASDALALRDVVFDVGTAANRPDLLGHLGVARELVARVGGRLRPPPFDLADWTDESLRAAELAEVSISDPEGCPRYVARVIDDLEVRPSPYWLRQRLLAAGIRPLQNLVDVTNYVLLELGQPLHAFDYAKVSGAHIDVRRAERGEKMTTLDEVERTLEPEDLLICDARGPIALAGVMGGSESEVSGDTRRVLLESANFLPASIRRTARRLGLHSESSHRFERGVDPNGAERASARASRLMAELGGGKVAAGAVDAYPRQIERRRVSMRASRASALTGVEFSRDRAADLLRRLGLEVSDAGSQGDVLEVECPTFRPDLEREIDLIEEVIRLHGFDQVPATLPPTSGAPSRSPDPRPGVLRRALVAAGLSEAITFGFTSMERIERLRLPEGDPRLAPVRVRNPMTVDQAVMRTSLLPNLLAAVSHNLKYDVSDVRLFEIGSVFLPSEGELPREPLRLCGVLSGRRPGWLAPARELDFFDAKGALERALAQLLGPKADAVRLRQSREIPYLHPGVAAEIHLGDDGRIGDIGEVHPEVRSAFEVESPCFAFELDFEALPPLEHRQMRPVPRYPAVTRDISFFVAEEVPAGRVRELVSQADQPLVEELRCLEDYRDPDKVPAGQKGMLWSITYRAPDRTLTDAEVDAAHEPLVQRLLQTLPATRR